MDQKEAGPVVQGWCPGALRPMASGDGLVVRVRPWGGRLTPAQAAGLAALATRHGNGRIDLTARANLQLRGVTEAALPALPALHAGLAGLGLLDPSPEAETRRNVIVTPFADAELDRVADALSRALVAAEDLAALPAKFGFAVDDGALGGPGAGGGATVAPTGRAVRPADGKADGPTPQGAPGAAATGVSADIWLTRTAQRWTLRADGSPDALPTADPVADALALARWFLAAGGAPAGRGRMRGLLAHGATPPLPPSSVPKYPGGEEASASEGAGPPAPVTPGQRPQGTLVGAAFGALDADQLAALAACGPLRLTPWRMVYVETAALPPIPGLLPPDHPLLHVHACTGAPGCPQGLGPTRDLARRLARPGLHVSGCAKGCAHPGPAPVVLVAAGGGRYDLVRAGTAADAPLARLTEAEIDAAFL